MKILRIGWVAAVLAIPAFTSGGTGLPSRMEGHRSGMIAKVISKDGTSQTVRLEGVGCSESMCSRVFIRGTSGSGERLQTWLDSIASITDPTGRDALFVMKDGTERRMALLTDFRVLYVSSRNGGVQKLDLAKIRSLEFLNSEK